MPFILIIYVVYLNCNNLWNICTCVFTGKYMSPIGQCCIFYPDKVTPTCDDDVGVGVGVVGHTELKRGVVYWSWNKLLKIILYAASVKCVPS